MRRYVDSLKRLYEAGKVTEVIITELLENGKISKEEYDYIIGA